MPANIAGNGTINAVTDTPVIEWPGGTGTVQLDGDFGGSTISLEVSLAGTTFTDGGTSVQATASGLFNFTVNSPCKLKLSPAGGTPDVDWWIGLPNNG